MKRISIASRWQPAVAIAIVGVASLAGCAMQPTTPTTQPSADGAAPADHAVSHSSTLPRLAPTQSTKGTGAVPAANGTSALGQ